MKLLFISLFYVSAILTGKAQNNPVVIELFTSQGCSSCPAADKNLSELLKQAAKDSKPVYGLSFHVDYWNYIGWKDPYSSKEFTARQRNYVQHLNLHSMYTPQMIVNGDEEFVGSNTSEAEARLKDASRKLPSYQITINDLSIANHVVTFRYALDKASNGEVLNVAVVERNVENYVSRGENEGKKLHHDNVVRSIKTIPLKQTEEIQIPIGNISIHNASVILYIQNSDWHVIGATAKSLASTF